ncbi:hypothetical protein CPS_0949 [Colwellia psychrerythraea 34H]|uniref:Uncharacterized protein n=1 Tax=Colwellia psychrerythraea (strain 34H / ATCC BAA-681) TaxID=167879 RepID=Q487R7_COLP3|nr:hypothetical protein CPS_0949 [Colwellia psychrerythraea 34H]
MNKKKHHFSIFFVIGDNSDVFEEYSSKVLVKPLLGACKC